MADKSNHWTSLLRAGGRRGGSGASWRRTRSVVFSNDVTAALALLDGKCFKSPSFAQVTSMKMHARS